MYHVDDYQSLMRPKLVRQLKAVRLDQTFYHAQGNSLSYKTSDGVEQKILDFVGGFGSCILGHNHPELVATAQQILQMAIPFHAQVSVRAEAGKLAANLNRLLLKRTQKSYQTVLLNTGSEAVEAALKHASLSYKQKAEAQIRSLERDAAELMRMVGQRSIPLSLRALKFMEQAGFNQGGFCCQSLVQVSLSQARVRLKTPFIFVSLKHAYHGSTSGALDITDSPSFSSLRPFTNSQVKFIEPDVAALTLVFSDHTFSYSQPYVNAAGQLDLHLIEGNSIAGVFVEPIQGEGGIYPVPQDFITRCYTLTRQHNCPLIFDEIQCGMGRTGTFLYSEQLGIPADYYLLSKSLGGGMAKIAALLIEKSHYREDFGMLQLSTYAEDDYSSALANKTLEIIADTPQLLSNATQMGDWLKSALQNLKRQFPLVIKDIRGTGLMLGLEWVPQINRSPAIRMLAEQGFLPYVIAGYLFHEHKIRLLPSLSNPQTLRIEPSALIVPQHCTQLISAIQRLCQILDKSNVFHLCRYMVGGEIPFDDSPVEDFNVTRPESIHDQSLPQVAFIGHMIEAEHLTLWDAGFALFSRGQKEAFFAQTYQVLDPYRTDQALIKSPTGQTILFNLIVMPVYSKIIHHHLRQRDFTHFRKQIDHAIEQASQLGCRVVGLGGYTSILTHNCKKLRRRDIRVTSGNALTVAMGIAALTQESKNCQIDVRQSTLAIIGARGNIGSMYAKIFASQVKKLIMIGRPGSESALGRLKIQIEAPANVQVSTDLNDIKEADIIVAASNENAPLIFPHMLKSQPVVICDISVPADTHPSVQGTCNNVRVIQGGVVKLPENSDLLLGGIALDPGHFYACMSETTLLGFEDFPGDYSVGNLTETQIAGIMGMAKKHHFFLGKMKESRSF